VPAHVRFVPATQVALADLQALVEACFAGLPRPPNWFARKLHREAVALDRSLLAFGPGDELVGYTLTGNEPGETTAHSAGLGVLPDWRRQGIGGALLHHLESPLRRAGFKHLRVLAEPPLRGFYRLHYFHPQAERHTLWLPGTGLADLDLRAHARRPWSLPGRAVAGWRAGTWTRTPDADAATVQLADGDAWAHLSREGDALLVQRLCVADHDDPAIQLHRVHAALAELRSCVHHDTAVLLYGCDIVSCVTASLLQAKWRVAQTSCEMQRDHADVSDASNDVACGDAVDKPGPPAA